MIHDYTCLLPADFIERWNAAGIAEGRATIELCETKTEPERELAMMTANVAAQRLAVLTDQAKLIAYEEAERLASCGYHIVSAGWSKLKLTLTVETGERYPVADPAGERRGNEEGI